MLFMECTILYYTSHSIAYSFSNTPLYFPSYFATFSPLSSFFEYKQFIYISLNKLFILLHNSKSCCIFALFFQAKDMRKQPHRVINNFCLYFKQLIILYLRMSEKIRIFAKENKKHVSFRCIIILGLYLVFAFLCGGD